MSVEVLVIVFLAALLLGVVIGVIISKPTIMH